MYKKPLKLIGFILVLTLILLLTACWDKVEIDQRSFVLAIGIDHVPPGERASMAGKHEEMQEILQREEHYRVTFVFPKQMMGVGETTVENVLLSGVSDNIYAVERQMQTRTDSQLFLGHLKTVVLGETVTKNRKMFMEVLDALESDPLISRKVSFAVAQGEAKEALQVQPKLEPMAGQFINELFEGEDRTSRAPLADLNDILISIHNNGNAAIPRLVYTKDELKLGGAAVIKDYEFVGWLGETESIVLQTIRNEASLFTIIVDYKGNKIPYQATEVNTKFDFKEVEGGYKMILEIEGEGDLMQHFIETDEDILDPAVLEDLQELVNERFREGSIYIIEKLQKEFETDILGFDEYIKKNHPKIWHKIGADWEEVFPTIEVEVKANTKIRRVGLSK